MSLPLFSSDRKSQTAVEYLLLFTIAAIIVFVLFKTLLPQSLEVSNAYFNRAATGIMGEPPPVFQAINLIINRTNCAWTGTWEESTEFGPGRYCYEWDSSRPFMCGRQHWGDENGDTRHYCCSSDPALILDEIIELICSDESECGIQECPDSHPFMVGRRHRGDENDKTVYRCASVTDTSVSMSGVENNCEWEPGGWTWGESAGVEAVCPPERPFLKGRWHDTGDSCGGNNGDENTCTQYLCCDVISYQ